MKLPGGGAKEADFRGDSLFSAFASCGEWQVVNVCKVAVKVDWRCVGEEIVMSETEWIVQANRAFVNQTGWEGSTAGVRSNVKR